MRKVEEEEEEVGGWSFTGEGTGVDLDGAADGWASGLDGGLSHEGRNLWSEDAGGHCDDGLGMNWDEWRCWELVVDGKVQQRFWSLETEGRKPAS